jgi:serine/threonine protein kinase
LNGLDIVVKSFGSVDGEKVNEILLLLMQLKHCCVAPLIGLVVPTESTPLKTGTLYYSCSLQDVLDRRPEWWTSTAKSKAIAGIALGMQSAHELGIVHGSLKPNNILFDDNHCVHVVDFCSTRFESKCDEKYDQDEMDDNDAIENAKKVDIFSFASILFSILVDDDIVSDSLPFDEEENQKMKDGELPLIPEFVPSFVRELLENGWSQDRSSRRSFQDMMELMEDNYFEFAEGVDVCDVLTFVSSVKSSCF